MTRDHLLMSFIMSKTTFRGGDTVPNIFYFGPLKLMFYPKTLNYRLSTPTGVISGTRCNDTDVRFMGKPSIDWMTEVFIRMGHKARIERDSVYGPSNYKKITEGHITFEAISGGFRLSSSDWDIIMTNRSRSTKGTFVITGDPTDDLAWLKLKGFSNAS